MYNHTDKSYQSRPKFMSDEVFSATLEAVKTYCDDRAPHGMWLTFHGGEPTLIGAEKFDRMAAMARDVLQHRLTQISIQTNGTLIDDNWCSVLRKHMVNVGLSLDGGQSSHDQFRVYHSGRGEPLMQR